jgi:uncharacterized OB-fold protein
MNNILETLATLTEEKRIKSTCEECGKVFSTPESIVDRNGGPLPFCSDKCKQNMNNKRIRSKS